MTQEFTILSAEWPAVAPSSSRMVTRARSRCWICPTMRIGFALELLLGGLGLGACSADTIRPARGAEANGMTHEASQSPGDAQQGASSHSGPSKGDAGNSDKSAGPVGPRFIGRFDHSNPDAPVF